MKQWIAVACLVLPLLIAAQAAPPQAAIATANLTATHVAKKILSQGGNAFDAAIAVAGVLGVVESFNSGLGGGGFWLLYDAKKNKTIFVDARERAPMNATETMFLDEHGKPDREKALFGPLAAAIPGQPAALAYVAKHYGKLPLTKSLAPAIKLAREGFKTDSDFKSAVLTPLVIKHLRQFPISGETFLYNNQAPEPGTRLLQEPLAKTLERLAQGGHKGFYAGTTAARLVKAVKQHGGIWTQRDLDEYRVKIRKPLTGYYKQHKIVTAPPPSAGGVAILTMLNILNNQDLPNLPLATRYQQIIEAMRLAYWDRAKHLGDPDYVQIPVNALLSRPHTQYLRRFIRKDQATPSKHLSQSYSYLDLDESENTTHFSIMDKAGNMASVTVSLNYLFGSSFVAKGTGVLLNNHMDDFATKPGAPNVYGLIGSRPNKIEAGKRPLSSMSPTFIFDKDHTAILGTPGGSRIPTMVMLAILDFNQGYLPEHWTQVRRFHHQFLPDVIEYEPQALSGLAIEKLEKMGYKTRRMKRLYGDMQAILWDKKDNKVYASADERHQGGAVVF